MNNLEEYQTKYKNVFEKADKLGMEILNFSRNKNKQLKIKLKCNNHPNKPERETIVSNFLRQKTCGCCLKFYDEDDFKQDINKITDIKLYGKYLNDTDKTEFICTKGHIFFASPNKIKQGRGCPFCKGDKLRKHFIKSTQQFKKELETKQPTIDLIGEYNGALNNITYRCRICGNISKSKSDKVLRGESGCHFCTSSKGERNIMIVLKKLNISYIYQKTFNDCRFKQMLPFDFYIEEFNTCIEFQGQQHFFPVDFSYTPTKISKRKARKNFALGKIRDRIKKYYCKTQGINLLEISYYDINQIPLILKKIFQQKIRNDYRTCRVIYKLK